MGVRLYMVSCDVLFESGFADGGTAGAAAIAGGGSAGLLLEGDEAGCLDSLAANIEGWLNLDCHLAAGAVVGEALHKVGECCGAFLLEEGVDVSLDGEWYGGSGVRIDGEGAGGGALSHLGTFDLHDPIHGGEAGWVGGRVGYIDVEIHAQWHLFGENGGGELETVSGGDVAIGDILHIDAGDAEIGHILERIAAVGQVGQALNLADNAGEYSARSEHEAARKECCKDNLFLHNGI